MNNSYVVVYLQTLIVFVTYLVDLDFCDFNLFMDIYFLKRKFPSLNTINTLLFWEIFNVTIHTLKIIDSPLFGLTWCLENLSKRSRSFMEFVRFHSQKMSIKAPIKFL